MFCLPDYIFPAPCVTLWAEKTSIVRFSMRKMYIKGCESLAVRLYQLILRNGHWHVQDDV